MKKRLIISSLISLPLLILIYKNILDKDWRQSVFGAIVWELIYLAGMLLFIKWWTKRARESNNIK